MLRITGLALVVVLAGCGGSEEEEPFNFELCRVSMAIFYGNYDCAFYSSNGDKVSLASATTKFCTDLNAATLPGRGCTSCRDEYDLWYRCFVAPLTKSCVECGVLFNQLIECKCSA